MNQAPSVTRKRKTKCQGQSVFLDSFCRFLMAFAESVDFGSPESGHSILNLLSSLERMVNGHFCFSKKSKKACLVAKELQISPGCQPSNKVIYFFLFVFFVLFCLFCLFVLFICLFVFVLFCLFCLFV